MSYPTTVLLDMARRLAVMTAAIAIFGPAWGVLKVLQRVVGTP